MTRARPTIAVPDGMVPRAYQYALEPTRLYGTGPVEDCDPADATDRTVYPLVTSRGCGGEVWRIFCRFRTVDPWWGWTSMRYHTGDRVTTRCVARLMSTGWPLSAEVPTMQDGDSASPYGYEERWGPSMTITTPTHLRDSERGSTENLTRSMMSRTRARRRPMLVAVGVAVIALTVGLTACGGGDDGPEADGGPPTPETSKTSPSTPAPTTPESTGLLAGYSEEEVDAYRDAVAVWKELGRVETRLMSIGTATPSARREILNLYVKDAERTSWDTLQDLDAAGAHTQGRARTVWIKPVRVLLDPEHDSGTVDLRTCVDATGVQVITSTGESKSGSQFVMKVTVDLDPATHEWRIATTSREGGC